MEAILNIKALVSNESCFQKVREFKGGQWRYLPPL